MSAISRLTITDQLDYDIENELDELTLDAAIRYLTRQRDKHADRTNLRLELHSGEYEDGSLTLVGDRIETDDEYEHRLDTEAHELRLKRGKLQQKLKEVERQLNELE